jgi:hypothetical protein
MHLSLATLYSRPFPLSSSQKLGRLFLLSVNSQLDIKMKFSILAAAAFSSLGLSTPLNPLPSHEVLQKRQNSTNETSSLQVDLGYSIYEGFNDNTTGLDLWQGIRYAAPPTGSMRWQLPQPPLLNRSSVIQASAISSQCPQVGDNTDGAAIYSFASSPPQDEDCLFLNVFAPKNAKDLPVLVWIHGGGYGAGNGNQDLSAIITTNNESFVGVAIQYRLGAFGFLSSDEVDRFGTVNAGIRDQVFALQWVQKYIDLFGGDPTRVTISGESAGGGSVMLQSMAFGGKLGTSLFNNVRFSLLFISSQHQDVVNLYTD